MMREKKGKKNRRGGFTLVELIVVLVILGILAAIMVPALLGWIDKARNQDAILECRNVVMAAQAQVAAEYGKGTPLNMLESQLNSDYTDIMTISSVNGEISPDSIRLNESVISYLEYKTEHGITVVYDLEGQPVYRIKDDSYTALTAKGHQDSLLTGMKKKGWIDSSDKITQALKNSTVSTDNSKNNTSKVVQGYLLELSNKEEFPAITETEKSQIEKLISNSGLSSNKSVLDNAVWKPIVTKDGAVILVANNDSSKMGVGNASGGIIYYSGKYYAKLNPNGNGVNTKYVSDTEFLTSIDLNDEYVKDNWVKLPVAYPKE